MSNGVKVDNYYSYYQNNAPQRKSGDSLGKDDFLKLLVTQLRYQDPLKPMEDREFIAQSAQFSALEQMQNINQNFGQFMRMQAITNTAALVGKEVTYVVGFDDEGKAKTKSGRVDEVKYLGGNIYLTIDDEEIPLEFMLSIKEASNESNNDSDEEQGEDQANS